MKYLVIENKGEIEIEALELMGASTKRDDTDKIGMFGSGNKFALACLLRNSIPVKVYSGNTEINITTIKKSYRGQEFDVIKFNDKETSLTLQMGKDWKIWQALREIYANAIDEGSHSLNVVTEINTAENITKFYIPIDNEEIQDFVDNLKYYFRTDDKHIDKSPIGEIYFKYGNNLNLYRKGIRCINKDFKAKSLFDYSLNDVTINESRILSYSYEAPELMWKMILTSSNPTIINTIINAVAYSNFNNEDDIFEYYEMSSLSSNLVSIHNITLNNEWINAIRGKWFIPPYMFDFIEDKVEKLNCHIVPVKFYIMLKLNVSPNELLPPSIRGKFGNDDDSSRAYKIVSPTSLQNSVFEKAMDFLIDCNYNINYRIEIANFVNKQTLGYADISTNTIVVSTNSLDNGVHDTINTIIEENLHLKSGAGDETRSFQTALINELINYMKYKNNIVI